MLKRIIKINSKKNIYLIILVGVISLLSTGNALAASAKGTARVTILAPMGNLPTYETNIEDYRPEGSMVSQNVRVVNY